MKEWGLTNVLASDRDRGRKKLVSPCAGVCILHTETKFCLGCYRTINEIAQWQDMSVDDQYRVIAELAQRRAADRRL